MKSQSRKLNWNAKRMTNNCYIKLKAKLHPILAEERLWGIHSVCKIPSANKIRLLKENTWKTPGPRLVKYDIKYTNTLNSPNGDWKLFKVISEQFLCQSDLWFPHSKLKMSEAFFFFLIKSASERIDSKI